MLAGLQQIGDEQTESYVLSYTPPESKEGSCHTLRVKVDRAGAAVRARSNYCATKPVDLIAGTPAAKELEGRATGAEAGTLKASMALPYFYTSPDVATVHLAMEIAPDVAGSHTEINLLGIATATDGSAGARFSDTLKDAPLHYEKDFKIAPGKYSFALAFGSGGASFGKLEASLDVEPWNPSELAISSVALSRETHPAGDLGLIASLVQDRTPLTAEGSQYVPFGSSQFAKSDMGFFYLEIHDPDPASVRVRVRVTDRKSGEQKWDSGQTVLPVPSGAKAWIPAGASLRLNTLGPGSYQLEIAASDSAGKQVKRTADFEVH